MDENINLTKFNEELSNGEATWWQMDLPSGNVIFGEAKSNMLGFPQSQFKKYQDFTDLLHPEDFQKTMDAMKNYLDGKTDAYEALYRIKTINGDYINFFDYGQISKKNGKDVTLVGFVMKIKELTNYIEETKIFKDLITSGTISVIDLFKKAHY